MLRGLFFLSATKTTFARGYIVEVHDGASIGMGYPFRENPWAVAQTRKGDFAMSGRRRTVQIKFRVTERERELIREKMKEIPTKNMAAYLRKVAIDGEIIHVDYSGLKELTAEIHKIGVNINQIAHRVNSEGNAYREDLRRIEEAVEKIWQLLRSSLLKARWIKR